jgi:hypothetical protein
LIKSLSERYQADLTELVDALINYSDSRKTRRLRNQVKQLNDRLLEADIEMTGPLASARLGKDGEV